MRAKNNKNVILSPQWVYDQQVSSFLCLTPQTYVIFEMLHYSVAQKKKITPEYKMSNSRNVELQESKFTAFIITSLTWNWNNLLYFKSLQSSTKFIHLQFNVC